MRAGGGRMAPALSYLFVPGNKPERFDKALASGADAVIVDLEDAVEPEAKVAYVGRLMFGTLDFIAEMGMSDDGAALDHFRSQRALISRVPGIESPVDGVRPDIDDGERIACDAFNGKQPRFGATPCIDPKQIGFVRPCFRPGDDEAHWARRVRDAMRDSNRGVVTVDGKMIVGDSDRRGLHPIDSPRRKRLDERGHDGMGCAAGTVQRGTSSSASSRWK